MFGYIDNLLLKDVSTVHVTPAGEISPVTSDALRAIDQGQINRPVMASIKWVRLMRAVPFKALRAARRSVVEAASPGRGEVAISCAPSA